MTNQTEKAILAGGCFWGVQDLIRKLPGVISTRVGYSGGDVPNATYRRHGNHAEAVEITFDPAKISFRDLLEFFFQIHDPSTKNRQGNDLGDQLPVGHLLHQRRAEAGRRGHHRRRGRLRPVARQGGHRGDARGAVLGGRA
jgi:methionine-S-sulfoxide reductase